MTVADHKPATPPASRPSRPAPPTPEECAHPAPVVGIMAHEFGAYRGALGPEGKRRTVMLYGPVVGGLPIGAWHCEACGLLRLDYPDGRKEERRLFPGPQPGMIAQPVIVERTLEALRGTQVHVAGVTAPPELLPMLLPVEPRASRALRLPRVTLPVAGWVDALTLALLALTAAGLCGLLYGAVADYRTADWEGGLAAVTGAGFGAAVALQVGAAAFRHAFPFPALAPSPAELHRGRPVLDPLAATVVAILVTVVVGLVLAGILAVYDWRTPGAEGPVVGVTFALCGLALVVAVAGGAVRRLLPPPPSE